MASDLNINPLDPWFLGGAILFALTSVMYFIAHWRATDNLKFAQRCLEVTLAYWALLLGCWLFQVGLLGASRLWFGLSALILGTLYRVSLDRYKLQSLGGSLTALSSLLAVFSYQLTSPSFVDLVDQTQREDGSTLDLALLAHIGCATAGMTAFAVSGAMSGLYLMAEKKLKSKVWVLQSPKIPSLSTLDAINLNGLLIGFPLYTAALLLGSASAFQGEGELRLSYIVALGSWIIYGGVLQARLTAGWRGRRAALLTLIAFLGLLLVAARYSFR
jgi:ABC-type uncharacterized transport system permease subunit